MNESLNHLLRTLELLELERAEDFRNYQQQFLSANIKQRVDHGLTWYPVVIESSSYTYGDYLLVDIVSNDKMPELHQFQIGKNAELFSMEEGQSLHGVIKFLEPKKLRLALKEDDLPDWIYRGKLGINVLFDEYSYKEMEINLQKVIKAQNNRLAQLRDIILGGVKPKFSSNSCDFSENHLNEMQQQGVKKIMQAEDVAIIHGPPGTGKTTTLVHAMVETLKFEKQIMVCSPSNVAIDVVCEKLLEQGLEILRIGNPVRVSEDLVGLTLDGKINSHPYYAEVYDFRKRAAEYRNLAQKYKRDFGKSEREQRALLFKEAKQLLKEADHLEEYILSDLLSKVQVIACTLVGASHKILRDKQFKTVFIDEAAQALEPASWIPITKANRVVFAGDHCQLPPTVKSKAASEKGLGISLFERCVNRHGDLAVMLDTQYRMNGAIMNFSSIKFYHSQLKADNSVAYRSLGLKDANHFNMPFEFIDTAGCGYEEQINMQTQSIMNLGEADVIKKHLQALLDAYHREKNIGSMKIGIISPYKEQTLLLNQELFNDELINSYRSYISIKSVDGFQGQEKDVIYISMVRSNDRGEIGFLSDYRRMNVALTRAKKKIVIVGDSATLANQKFYADFLDYVESINAYKSAWEYMTM